MKVLMFGWEFPPHISGGLGTACQGLTEALGKMDTNIIFVVPKLFGGENALGVSFVEAESVKLKKSLSSRKASSVKVSKKISKYNRTTEPASLTKVEVSSYLTPYQSIRSEHKSSEELLSWNYELTSERLDQLHEQSEHTSEHIYSHSFSGAYGNDLIGEVNRYAEVAAEIARRSDFDVIHIHDWMTMPAGIEAKRVSNKPLIVHVHSTEFDRSGENIDPRIFALEQKGMQEADKILAVSQWTKDIIVSRFDIAEDKVEVVHNGISPKLSKEIEGLPSLGTHVVTFLGRITYQKGPLYFVRAAEKVLQKFPDAHFVLAGSGDMFPLVIEKVASMRISSRFHFTGFLKGEHVDKIWNLSSVYVMPSVSEPFGITPLEAILAGVPAIVSNQSGVSEVMPHAIKVDFWKTDELADAICNVLAYQSLSSTLQKNAFETTKNITWNRTAKKVNTIYHELTS